jgi:glycosyltransferase involved in cell wall biosynthesis
MPKTVAQGRSKRAAPISFSVSRPERIVTIHSGVDIERYSGSKVNVAEKKRSLGLPSYGLVVGMVGWLLPIKGPMYLLKAMERVWENHRGVTLVFVGKGELEGQLRAEASRAGVSSKVDFLGWRDDVPEIMQVLDIFVLPSLNEGMGRVLVEAMAAGKPIIASRAGGIVDLVKDGENGLLIEPGDVDGLYLAIERLLNDREMRYDMGQRGKVIAREFSIERMLEKIEGLYSSLIHQLGDKRD